jgi:hypothetical protein
VREATTSLLQRFDQDEGDFIDAERDKSKESIVIER